MIYVMFLVHILLKCNTKFRTLSLGHTDGPRPRTKNMKRKGVDVGTEKPTEEDKRRN